MTAALRQYLLQHFPSAAIPPSSTSPPSPPGGSPTSSPSTSSTARPRTAPTEAAHPAPLPRARRLAPRPPTSSAPCASSPGQLPGPEVDALEADAPLLRAAFLLMERVRGEVLGLAQGAEPGRRRAPPALTMTTPGPPPPAGPAPRRDSAALGRERDISHHRKHGMTRRRDDQQNLRAEFQHFRRNRTREGLLEPDSNRR